MNRSRQLLEQSRSLIETRERSEVAQLDLVNWLKWIVLLIGAMLVAIFLKAIFMPAPPAEGCAADRPFYAQVKDSLYNFVGGKAQPREQPVAAVEVRPRREAGDSGEGFWNSLLPNWGCQAWRDLKAKLANLRLSVKPSMPELPSLEAIRANPARFNISLPEMSRTRIETLTKVHPPEEVFRSLNNVIDLGNIDFNQNVDATDAVRAALAKENDKGSALQKATDDDAMADLRVKLADVAGSQKLLLAKRNQISDLRARLLNAFKALKECELKEKEVMDKLDEDRTTEKNLLDKIKDVEREEAGLRDRITEKEKSLNEGDRKNRETIMALNNRATDLKNIVNRRGDVDREIQEKRTKVSRLGDDQSRLVKQLADEERRGQSIDSQLDDLEPRRRQLEAELKSMSVNQRMYSTVLGAMVTQRDMKNCLFSMIKEGGEKCFGDQTEVETISERELQLAVENYEREVLDVSVTEQIDKKQVKSTFDKNRAEIQELIRKYRDWQRIISEYKVTGAEIREYQDKLRQLEENIRQKRLELESLDRRRREFETDKKTVDENVRTIRNKIRVVDEETSELNTWINKKLADTSNAEEEWNRLQKEISESNAEYSAYKQNISQLFGDLDRQQDDLRGQKNQYRLQLNEVQPRIKLLTEQLERAKGECAALKAFYSKTAEAIPALQAVLDSDRQKMAQLKSEITKAIEPFYNA